MNSGALWQIIGFQILHLPANVVNWIVVEDLKILVCDLKYGYGELEQDGFDIWLQFGHSSLNFRRLLNNSDRIAQSLRAHKVGLSFEE